MSKKKKERYQLEGKIISLFKSRPKAVLNYKQIAAALDIKDTKGRNNIIKVLNTLHSQDQLDALKPGQYQFNNSSVELVSTQLTIIPSGKGVVKVDGYDEELIVPKKFLNKGLHGDQIEISIHKKNKQVEAHVENILERSNREYVGVFERQKDFGFVLCRSGRMYTDLFIEREELKNYKDGEKVVAVLKDWQEKRESPSGRIIKSLGQPGEKETEIHAILHEYGLPYEFPKEIEEAAEKIKKALDQKEIKKRRDFRDVLTFTIDPITAKDFDDALSFKTLSNGLFEVGIHIADVSYYVQPNTILDQEAYDRATSVYLVDRVVPMLPEVLSNGLCSLRPKEEKFTFSAVFILNIEGTVQEEWYGRTVINSDYRFSYEEVQDVLENQKAQVDSSVSLTGKTYILPDNVFKAINILDFQAKKLRSQRMKNGAISFDRVEVNFHLDDENNPESVYFKTSKDAHKLIEEFMLLANKKVAGFINKIQPLPPFVYRTHDDPDEQKLFNLKQTISPFGYSFNPNKKNVSSEINGLLLACNGKKEQNLIDTLTLRCMSKAEYSTDNIGHYGLAFSHYTHFTSPIRRYPDVMVHRLLQTYLDKKPYPSKQTIEEACQHSSQREQLATRAERDSIKYMQMVFMEDKVGQIFNGVISGVTDRGLYVELIDNKCEGMIRVMDIKGDFFHYDDRQHAFIGERTKKAYQLGDTIAIKVKKVNILRRFLDFVPA
ncbi:MAG: ribonuclease R [Flavobacteriaceae bacterium]|nr:ribonuclease R [Flavobacteriaceae bacterium]